MKKNIEKKIKKLQAKLEIIKLQEKVNKYEQALANAGYKVVKEFVTTGSTTIGLLGVDGEDSITTPVTISQWTLAEIPKREQISQTYTATGSLDLS